MKHAIIYTTFAIILAILGYFKDPTYYLGAIIVALLSFYWIWKEWKED